MKYLKQISLIEIATILVGVAMAATIFFSVAQHSYAKKQAAERPAGSAVGTR